MNKFLNIIYIKKTNKTSKQTKQKNNVKIERVPSARRDAVYNYTTKDD